MRRGLTLRMGVAGGLLAIVIGTAFAFLLLAITDLREATHLARDTQDELIAAD
jgi:hypothetical protein